MTYNDLRLGRYSAPDGVYHITTVTFGRVRYFDDLGAARSVITEMRRLDQDHVLESLAWVLMPDHVHWLFRLGSIETLGEAMKLFKGRSAQSVNRVLGRRGKVWQIAYYDHAVRKDEDIVAIARYIVANPVRAGLVERVGQYPFWDARWL